MINKKQNPFCSKCQAKLNKQDSRGWEFFKKMDETGLTTEDIWICPKCISIFEHTVDLLSLKDSQRKKDIEDLSNFHSPITDGAMKIYSELEKIKIQLNKINDETAGHKHL